MRRRFFVEKFSDKKAVLEGPSAHHLAQVLRAQPGQLYELSDGKNVFLARVENVLRDSVNFALLEPLESRSNRVASTLLLAIVKFDRFEWAIEKATELGVSTIVPLAAMRSERSLVAAAPKRAERWRKILFESAQQSRCLRPPELREISVPAAAFKTCAAATSILLSERSTAPPLKSVLDAVVQRQQKCGSLNVALAIGPEGGWTDEEFTAAQTAGFRETSLGVNILRTETAVLAALAAVHLYFD